LRSFFSGRLFRRAVFTKGVCIDSLDSRFAVISLDSSQGAHIDLWMWGEDGVPAHDDRLLGYLGHSSGDIGGKIALWRR
jgi:hypothetical protein